MKHHLVGLAFALTLSSPLAALAQPAILVPTAPPPLLQEAPAPMTAPGSEWIPGHWIWNGQQYAWQQGRWDRPPAPGARWLPARWQRRGRMWMFAPGRWRGPRGVLLVPPAAAPGAVPTQPMPGVYSTDPQPPPPPPPGVYSTGPAPQPLAPDVPMAQPQIPVIVTAPGLVGQPMHPHHPGVILVPPAQPGVVLAQPAQPGVVLAQPAQPGVVLAQPARPGVFVSQPARPGVIVAPRRVIVPR
jgi:hypothetical protein